MWVRLSHVMAFAANHCGLPMNTRITDRVYRAAFGRSSFSGREKEGSHGYPDFTSFLPP